MSEPRANMWINAKLSRKESVRAQIEMDKADVATREAVVEVQATSRELRE